VRDSLGDRMKRYEAATKTVVPHRQPTIIRVDGKAFHTYTRGLEKPWSWPLASAMDHVAAVLCEQIQNAVMAYVQSDEISVLLHPYRRYQTQAWFDGEIQKCASVAAGIASAEMTAQSRTIFDGEIRPAVFDGRVFVVPNECEANNYFVWRQQDATRNSIQMLARSLYSHKECHLKTCPDLQEMCFQKGQNWNNLPTYWKRGRAIVKGLRWASPGAPWEVNLETPIFSQEPGYVANRLAVWDETKTEAAE
jgi:tRNA(His) guanylyltransferase